jgi:hypothetical protein
MDRKRNTKRSTADASELAKRACSARAIPGPDNALDCGAGTDSNLVSDNEVALIERFLGELLREMLRS